MDKKNYSRSTNFFFHNESCYSKLKNDLLTLHLCTIPKKKKKRKQATFDNSCFPILLLFIIEKSKRREDICFALKY